MRQAFRYLAACLLLNILVLAGLVWLTSLPNRQSNGFTRHWWPVPVLLKQQQLSLPVTHIAGIGQSQLYFTGLEPQWVLVTDTNLATTDTLYLSLESNANLHNLPVVVDSPHIYLYAKSISYIITGNTNNAHIDTTHLLTPLFTRQARISSRLLIIRGFDSSRQKQVFKQVDAVTGQVLKQAAITEDRADAGFSTDGYLQYDSATHNVLYIQQYQNRFFCLDTNLNIVYTAHTIDTTYTNAVTVNIVQKEKDIKLLPATPRVTVNLDAVAANGYLYIVSGLRADNEAYSDFNRQLPVDVYDIRNGQYAGSFYLPKMQGKKIAGIAIHGSLLVLLYQQGWAASFRLPAGVLRHAG